MIKTPHKLILCSSALALVSTLISCGGGGGSGDFNEDIYFPREPDELDPWQFEALNYDRAKALGLSGSGILVAVLDTGIDLDSPYLVHAISPDSVRFDGYNMLDAQDNEGHGTAMASLIAGLDPDTGEQIGLAPDATILAVAVNDYRYDPIYFDNATSISEGIYYAVDQGAQIINASFGGDFGTSYDDDLLAFEYAMQNDVIVFFATGNEGNFSDPTYYAYHVGTADYNGLGVAVTALDESGEIASFASPCNVFDPYYCIAVPGQDIPAVTDPAYAYGEYEILIDGTSPATAIASGSMALLLEYFPNLTPHQAVEILLVTADDLGAPGVDYVYGSGALNLERALQPVGATTFSNGQNVNSRDYIALSPILEGSDFAQSPQIAKIAVADDYDRAYSLDARQAVFSKDNPIDTQYNAKNYVDFGVDGPLDTHLRLRYGQVGFVDDAHFALGKTSILNRDIPFASEYDMELAIAKAIGQNQFSLSYATNEAIDFADWQLTLKAEQRYGRANGYASYAYRHEDGRFLGSEFSQAFGSVDQTTSQTITIGVEYDARQFDWGLEASMGQSDVEMANNNGIVSSFDDITYSSLKAKIGRGNNIFDGDRFDFAFGRGIALDNGQAELNPALGLDGNIDLASQTSEWLLETGYSLPLSEQASLNANWLYRVNADYQEGENDQIFKLQLEYKF